ncbi:MAG: DNA translocase FtsK [Lysinibacillus sp.]
MDQQPEKSVPQLSTLAMSFEEQVKEVVEKELTFEQVTADHADINVNEVIVENLQIENSTINIGEVTVVQPVPSETIAPTAITAEQEAIMAQPMQEKSRIPFNVLMLKADKEKWQNRQKQNVEIIQKATEEVEELKNSVEEPMPERVDTIDVAEEAVEQDVKVIEIVENVQTECTENLQPISFEESILPVREDEEIAVITMAPVAPTAQMEIAEEPVGEAVQSIAFVEEQNEQVEVPSHLDTAEVINSVVVHDVAQEEPAEILDAAVPITTQAEIIAEPKKPVKVYHKPSDEFLEPPEEKTQDTVWMEAQGETLIEALSHFQVTAQMESIMQGPAVTQFEITVSQGTKVSKIRNLADDLKLALAAKDIRIQAPIPGKSTIGIEIPNRVSRAVRLSEVTNSESFIESDSPLEAALGLDLTGKPVTIDLRKMPHGLIAGATGSGKSVCINSILVSLLYKAAPHELKLMLIDPKMVELAPFNHIPHLVSPVITDVKAATAALKWAVEEMERRYQLFAHAGARDITRYNAIAEKNNEHSLKLPYILIVNDELADLMMMSPADVEEAICRIAQKARACGIHLIVATQRPSVDVITGLIKSNIPTRIAFAVSSQIDSRTILDGQGAERLLGRGDMLYLGNGMSAPVRLQGTFVTDDEIEAIIDYVREQGEPDYIFDQEELLKKAEITEVQDDLFEDVCRFVLDQGGASTSSIQRKYHIGYNRAARLVDMLESHGFVSEARGSKPRESYITEQDIITMFE